MLCQDLMRMDAEEFLGILCVAVYNTVKLYNTRVCILECKRF